MTGAGRPGGAEEPERAFSAEAAGVQPLRYQNGKRLCGNAQAVSRNDMHRGRNARVPDRVHRRNEQAERMGDIGSGVSVDLAGSIRIRSRREGESAPAGRHATMKDFEIRPLRIPPWTALEPLVAESGREGFRFLARLRREHEAGEQRFDGPGEVLLGVHAGDAVAAVGGVTADPYEPGPRAGRIRHVYVARGHRRRGIGRMLVRALIAAARPHFDALTLRTDTPGAARFYEALGFAPVPGSPHHTHRLRLA